MPKTSRRTPKRAAKKRTTTRHTPTRGLDGWITHTELASNDPAATEQWAAKVLGWTIRPPFPMPDGDQYRLFRYSDKGGGGIRRTSQAEKPGSVPYIHVADAQAAFDKAVREGAVEVQAPLRIMEGVTTAIVRAPGGVTIGISGP